MKKEILARANRYAQMSCTRWNRAKSPIVKKLFGWLYKASRRKNREKYRAMLIPGEGENTYPWPFCDYGFADWPEDDSPEGYSLISDPSGCVIRYSTSYCAWKIYEQTGRWPQKTAKIRLDAKNWIRFLREAGYPDIVAYPSVGGKYVGIKPDVGEFGLCVWFEGEAPEKDMAVASSYVDKVFFLDTVKVADFTWVRIV